MTVQAGPRPTTEREPNCKPGDPVDAEGLVHDWKLVTEDEPGDVYKCPRCGADDTD